MQLSPARSRPRSNSPVRARSSLPRLRPPPRFSTGRLARYIERSAHTSPIARSSTPRRVRSYSLRAKPQPLPAQNFPDGSARSQASSTQPIVYQTVNQPVVERVIERQRVVAEGGITEAALSDRLNLLENKLRSLIFSQSSQQSARTSAVYNAVALSQRIDNLSGTNISNPTITGGSITGTSIIGTISNAIATALATIDDLTSTTITATNATFTNSTTTNATTTNLYAASLTAGNATSTSLAVLGAATSSFGGGISAARVSATATSTFSGLVLESG